MMTNEARTSLLAHGQLSAIAARTRSGLVTDLLAAAAVALTWSGAVVAFLVM